MLGSTEAKLGAMNSDPRKTETLLETWGRFKIKERTQYNNNLKKDLKLVYTVMTT